MFYSGIDQHKRDCYITTYGSQGEVVKQKRVPNSSMLIRRYFSQLPGPHKAVFESTGSWYWLANLLETVGVELSLAHTTRLKAISAAKVKTNKIDSDVLAMLLYADLIPKAHMICPEMRGLRDLMRTRLRLVQKCVSCKNSIERLLEKYNVQRVADLDGLYRLQAACHEAQIDLLQDQIRALEAALQPHLIPNVDIQRLLWVPGIGKVKAFTLYTEIDGIERFPSARQFFSYCRLVPGAANTGTRTRHRSGSKQGNRYLKLAFGHAAVRAMQYYPEIRAFYRAKRRKKPERIARTLVSTRDRSHRLSRAQRAARLQRAVQGLAPQPNQTVAVAAPGKPSRLTDSTASGVMRLIGKPGVVPGSYLGPLPAATGRPERHRPAKPKMVFGRHRG